MTALCPDPKIDYVTNSDADIQMNKECFPLQFIIYLSTSDFVAKDLKKEHFFLQFLVIIIYYTSDLLKETPYIIDLYLTNNILIRWKCDYML